jgi:hypothetical protein
VLEEDGVAGGAARDAVAAQLITVSGQDGVLLQRVSRAQDGVGRGEGRLAPGTANGGGGAAGRRGRRGRLLAV